MVQDYKEFNRYAATGVAVREFPLAPGHGEADYLLWVNGNAVGVVEAKPVGWTLTGVEIQSAKYSTGVPDTVDAVERPLPFLYDSTAVETRFTVDVLAPCLNGHTPHLAQYSLLLDGPWFCDNCTQPPQDAPTLVGMVAASLKRQFQPGNTPDPRNYLARAVQSTGAFPTDRLRDDNPFLTVPDDILEDVLRSETHRSPSTRYLLLFFDRKSRTWHQVPGFLYFVAATQVALFTWHDSQWWLKRVSSHLDAIEQFNKAVQFKTRP